MIKLKCFLILITLLNIYDLNSQKQSFSEKGITFFIKSHYYFNKELADSLNNKFQNDLKLFSIKTKDSSTSTMKNTLEIADYDRRSIKYFRINPKSYIYFTIRNLKDSIMNENNFTNITKIDRDSLTLDIFNIRDYKHLNLNYRERYKDYGKNFKLVKTNFNYKKVIAGFNCYEVIFESEVRILQMFVTEDIKLNYHPEINDKEILKNYYPLYIKMMRKKYPKRNYTESVFYKGLYN
jgi:hypothetical protein